MGAELGVLSNYSLYDPTIKQDSTNLFSLHSATHEDGRPASVFIHEDDGSGSRTFAENEVKLLRRLRHPHIVKYMSSTPPADEGPVQLVVEFVQPLESIETNVHSMEIGVGLRCITAALQFLHEKCRISHNNVCRDSVVVAGSDRTWRLAGFALASTFESTSSLYLKSISEFRDPDSIPPEDRSKSPSLSSCTHARDAWGLGALALSFADELSSCAELEATLSESLLHPDPECRPSMKDQLSSSIFSNPLVKVIQFINNITLKEAKEKSAFFRGLPRRLQQIPAELIAQYLTSRLLSRFVLLEESAREHVVPRLLLPQPDDAKASGAGGGFIPGLLYQQHVVPLLLKLLSVEDKHVRLVLLEYLPHYLPFMEITKVKERLLPHVLVGLREDDDDIVEATFHALGFLVPVLGAAVVVGCKSVTRFSASTPRPADGPLKFYPQSLRPTTSAGAATRASPTTSFSSSSSGSSTRHAQAKRPLCLRMEGKQQGRLHGQRQSPKRVTFSPDNDFPTTEEALLQSPTWSKMSKSGGHASSAAADRRVNGAVDSGAASSPAGTPRDEASSRSLRTRPDDEHNEASYMADRIGTSAAPGMASGVVDDVGDDDEPWEDFDDDSAGNDGWGATNGDAGGQVAAGGGGGGGGDGGEGEEEAGDWVDMNGNDDDDDFGGGSGGRDNAASDWSSQHQAGISPTASKSPKSHRDSSSPLASSGAASAAPSPKGLNLKSKTSAAQAAPAKAHVKPAEPPPPPLPVSEEDALLAMLEPDIKFSSKPAAGVARTKSTPVPSAPRGAGGKTTSSDPVTSLQQPARSPSPPAASAISFAYNPDDVANDTGEGWGDDDFGDF